MEWPGPHYTCVAFAAFRMFNAFAAWMALGFVAFSRCLSLTKPALSKKLSRKNGNFMMVVSIWVYAGIMVLPSLPSIELYGKFGYDKDFGKCDYMAKDGKDPKLLFWSLGFCLPLIIIVVSYLIIWRSSTQSSLYLRQNSLDTKRQINIRDRRMTATLFAMSFLYVLFVSPIVLCGIFKVLENWNLVFFILYWLQYGLNFVVYAARSEQYRMAYKLYIKKQLPFLFRICKTKERNSVFFINSSPELDTNKGKNKEDIPVRVGRSLDVEMEKVMISYIDKVQKESTQ